MAGAFGMSGVAMHLTIRLLGLEFLHVELGEDTAAETEAGDCTTTLVGFAPGYGAQRYEQVVGGDVE